MCVTDREYVIPVEDEEEGINSLFLTQLTEHVESTVLHLGRA